MTAQIRKACEADVEILSQLDRELQEIHAAAIPAIVKLPDDKTHSPEKINILLTNPKVFIFVGVIESEVVGYIKARITEEPENDIQYSRRKVFISHIYVRPGKRGNGVGKGLIDAAKAVARRENIDSLDLSVMAFNANARSFFRKCGFAPFLDILSQNCA